MAKATLDTSSTQQPAVVVDYASVSRTARSKSDSLNGLASQRAAAFLEEALRIGSRDVARHER
jgi:hypothetical protein